MCEQRYDEPAWHRSPHQIQNLHATIQRRTLQLFRAALYLNNFTNVSSSQPFFFFFNDTATTEIYTLSLHDAFRSRSEDVTPPAMAIATTPVPGTLTRDEDRKSTRLNSSHSQISYAVFCLKKKKTREQVQLPTTEPLSHHVRTAIRRACVASKSPSDTEPSCDNPTTHSSTFSCCTIPQQFH